MREFQALNGYPEPLMQRSVRGRDIHARLIAAARGAEFFDGKRKNGYGGLRNDGRWKPIAKFMAHEYGLSPGSSVLQIQCEKGFLLDAFMDLDMRVRGTETSPYAARECPHRVKVDILPPTTLPYFDKSFELVIAIGAVYTLPLDGAVQCLREIERVGTGKSFITLGAYETEDDLKLLRAWSLLGCTILTRDEWREVMVHAGYSGDYKFVTAKGLGLKWI